MKRKIVRVELKHQGSTFPPSPFDAPLLQDGQVTIEPPPADPRSSTYHIPTDYTRRQVELLVSFGHQQDFIAYIIGVSINTLKKHYETEIKFGKQKANMAVAYRLFDVATRGTGREALTAIMFWMKTQAGWSESLGDLKVLHEGTIQHEHTQLSHEDRAVRLLQVFAAARARGDGPPALEHLRAMVTEPRPADPGVLLIGG